MSLKKMIFRDINKVSMGNALICVKIKEGVCHC